MNDQQISTIITAFAEGLDALNENLSNINENISSINESVINLTQTLQNNNILLQDHLVDLTSSVSLNICGLKDAVHEKLEEITNTMIRGK